ncbi:MAG: SRPBCC family protein [Mariprofundaceae bacterium]
MPQVSWAEFQIDSKWGLSPHEISEIHEERIVVHKNITIQHNVHHIEALFLVNAPVEHLFSLMTDYDQLTAYAPNLQRVDIMKKYDHGALVNYALALPFNVEKAYRLQLNYTDEGEHRRIAWKSVPWPELNPEETIVSTSGFWLLQKAEKPNTTFLVYQSTTNPGHVPWGLGWIVNYLSTDSVLALLSKTKERAEEQWLNLQATIDMQRMVQPCDLYGTLKGEALQARHPHDL